MIASALNPHPSHPSHPSHDAFAALPVTFILAAIQGADAARDDAAIGGITDNPYTLDTQAARDDAAIGGITDNPYTLDTQAARDWYAGYNFQMNRELQT
jgi:hypothetical protein